MLAQNSQPTANDLSLSTPEDTPLINIKLTASDSDGTIESYSISKQPIHGTLTATGGDSIYTYTPELNYVGQDSFLYVAVDDSNATSNTATATITVSPVNDPPIAVNDTYTINEDTELTDNVLDNDSDVESGTLTTAVIDAVSNGTLTLNSDGTFSYTGKSNYNGSDNFTYQLNDGAGGLDTATVSITVSPVNDPPIAVNDTYTINEDTELTDNVLDNDSDVESGTLTTAVIDAVSNGTLTLNSDGTFSYTGKSNYNGSDNFTYQLNDGAGGLDTATVSITVSPVNDPPIAVNDTYTINEDTELTDNVLDNDSDVESGTLTTAVIDAVSNGTLTLNSDGTFSYTGKSNYNGSDNFTYQLNDGAGGLDTATVSITVSPVNDPPIAVNDTYTINEDTELTDNVLDNDSDVESGTLTTAVIDAVSNGTLTLNSDGTFSYTGKSNYNGSDNFTYQLNDGAGGLDTATVSITVSPVN